MTGIPIVRAWTAGSHPRHALFEAVARWPFRQKLTLLLLMSAAMALLTACSALILAQYHNDRTSSDRRFAQIAEVVSSNVAAAIIFEDTESLRETLSSVSRISDIEAVHVFDAGNREVADYVKPGAMVPPGRAHQLPRLQGLGQGIVITASHVVAPVMLNGLHVGTVAFDVSRTSFAENFRASFKVAFAVFLLGLGLSYGLGMILRSMVFGPIERLTQTMQAIGDSGDFSTRLADESDPDFERIVRSFNYMLGEIESRNEQLSAAVVEVRAARDAEQISEAKSLFMANMSHELRTPLNAIIGYAEVLKEDLADTNLAQSREDVGWIYSSARQLMALINGVLDFSKINAGKMTVEVQSFALAPLLAEVEAMLEPMASASGNRLVIEASAAIETLRNDPTKLRQCLLNLGSNACKFTRNGRITISARASEEMICFDVKDTGTGIDASLIPMLFEPFTQGDASITRKHGGTGLGLPITRELARFMGGTVSVTSTRGKGSVFTLAIQRALQPDAITVRSGKPDGVPILVIDSHPEDFSKVAAAAEARGYRLIMAGDAGAAGDLIREHQPRLVILDLDLPEFGEPDRLAHLRAEPAFRELSFVTTTRSRKGEGPVESGADELLAKPLDREAFIELLALYTRRHHGTILIVEDDTCTAALHRRAVENIGFTAVIAESGEQALDLMEQMKVSLVISDLGLPGMSGFDMVDILASQPADRRIPIVVMTGRKLSYQEVSRLRGKTVKLEFKGGLSPRIIAQLAATHALPG